MAFWEVLFHFNNVFWSNHSILINSTHIMLGYSLKECPMSSVAKKTPLDILLGHWTRKKMFEKMSKSNLSAQKNFLDIKLVIIGPNGVVWYPSWPQTSKKNFWKNVRKWPFGSNFFFEFAYDNKRPILHRPWKFGSLGRKRSKGHLVRE